MSAEDLPLHVGSGADVGSSGTGSPAPVLSDDPIAEPSEDELGRGDFVAQTSRLIRAVASGSNSTVFGLVAPWGAGKTSLLNLIRTELECENWGVVEFNPWEVADIDSLTREFIVTLSAALPANDKGARAKEALQRYGRRAASLASFVKVPGIDIGKLTEALIDATDPGESLEAVRKALVDRLQDLDEPIMVLVDDVDRLQSDELLTLLKLVRVVGRLPNVFYLLAFDEGTLRSVLERSDVGSGTTRSQTYLEKIVQVRVDVPTLHHSHRLEMSNRCMDAVISRHDVALSDQDWERFSRVYHDHLATLLSGPRQIKRYYAQVEAYLPLVGAEVNFVDYCLVTAVRTFFPTLHAELPRHARALTGSEFRMAKPSEDEERERWAGLVRSHVPETSTDIALRLLATLFRPVHQSLDKWSHGPGDADSITLRRGVGSGEYFDRYFFLGVPPDDISDAEVRDVIAEAVSGGGELTARVLELFEGATNQTALAEPMVDKLRRFSPTDPESSTALLPFAASIARSAPDTGFMGRTSMAARWWFTGLLADASLEDPVALLDALEGSTGIVEIGWAFAQGESNDEVPQNAPQRTPFRDELVRRIRAQLDDRVQRSVAEEPGTGSLLFVWAALKTDSSVREWLQDAAITHPWTVEDVSTFFVERRSLVGRDDWHLGGFDEERADRLLGLRFILDHLAPAPDGKMINWNGNVPDTFDERLRRVHAAMERISARLESHESGT